MTIHEVTIAIGSILKRKKLEMIFHAKCLGAEIKDIDQEEEIKVSKEQELAMIKSSEELLKSRGLTKRGN